MPAIHVLPVHLVNKIAAGEVIERPASVVKELVENAIDAGPGRIDVAVEDGGKRLIMVSDDGGGMGKDDLALAFAPHATSKIAAEDDLYTISTMGFRGEALASIASISHASIRTRRRAAEGRPADDSGYEVEASGHTVGPVRPCASAPGTTVTVRDLFYNTPARRKFLKSTSTEMGHISEQITRLALPHPHVAFSLTHNGRQVQVAPAAASTSQRVGDLFGPELAAATISILPRGTRAVGVQGLICRPDAARASANWQYFFLNGRYIRDRLLSHALKEAYRGLTDSSRWPVAFIFITVPPEDVDVNVHPTKVEVRFRDGQAVHGELLAALRDTLNRANLSPAVQLDGAAGLPESVSVGDAALQAALVDQGTAGGQRNASLRQALADFFKSAPKPQPRLSFPETARRNNASCDTRVIGGQAELREQASQRAGTAAAPESIPPDFVPGDGGLAAPASPEAQLPSDEVPGSAASANAPAAVQVSNSYIVTEDADGLVIIDQHALDERLTYNDLQRRVMQGRLEGQRRLIPEVMPVTAAESQMIQERADMLARLGLEVVPFGPATVAIQQFPSLLASKHVEPASFVRELLDRLKEDETVDGERLLEGLLETMACKAAVKAGDPLTQAEIDHLLARRAEADKVSSCPHGRPTMIRLSLKDLQKHFKRT